MSLSNPTLENSPHPCQRWFEWDGDNGVLKYYDKEKKESVRLPEPKFQFIVLDQTATIRGYNDKKKIFFRSNEIRDTGKDILTVKSSDNQLVAQGIYSQIRDRVIGAGARFNANIYIAYKNGDGGLALACIQLKGGALNSWVEFTKKNRAALRTNAVKITGFTEHKTGKIEYRLPVFAVTPVSGETIKNAVQIDQFLQDYLKIYFSRKTTQQVESAASPHDRSEGTAPRDEDSQPDSSDDLPPDPEDDVPF